MVFYGRKLNTKKRERFTVSSFATSGIGEMIMKEESGTLMENLFKEPLKGKALMFLYLS